MSKQVIIFNGPPFCGKDSAADYVRDEYGANKLQFKDELFRCVLDYYPLITRDEFFELYDNRETKEVPCEKLSGLSPRQAMIHVSENVMKPLHGQDYFGQAAALKLEDGLNVFSDGGFVEELGPVYDACEGRMTIVHLYRGDHTYERYNDSRGYVQEFRNALFVRIDNDGTLEDFHDAIDGIFL